MGNFFGGYTASAIRSLVVILILLPVALFYRQLSAINWKHNRRYIIGMLLSSLFTWGPFYYAILHAGIAVGLAVSYAGIIIGMFFFGWLFVGERFTRDKLLATIVSFIGLWLVFSPNISGFKWIPIAAAAVSGLSAASNGVFAKQIRYNATQSTICLWVTSFVANTLMAFVVGESHPSIGWHAQWLYLVFFAVSSILASWTFIKGVKLIEAGAAGILGLLEIGFGVLFGVLFFSEHVGFVVLVGIAIIILAAAIPYIKDYNAKRGTLDS